MQPLWYEPIYNTTKAALMMFCKTLATEVVGDNIRVNCINPGLVLTPDWVKTAKQLAGEDGYEAHLQGVADETPRMKRFATPEELAHFFVFLCSDKATLLDRLDLFRRWRDAEDGLAGLPIRPPWCRRQRRTGTG